MSFNFSREFAGCCTQPQWFLCFCQIQNFPSTVFKFVTMTSQRNGLIPCAEIIIFACFLLLVGDFLVVEVLEEEKTKKKFCISFSPRKRKKTLINRSIEVKLMFGHCVVFFVCVREEQLDKLTM